MRPNPNNFCGGNFSGWLEVMLWDKCNGRCGWCIEKEGYHPDDHISCEKLADRIIETGKNPVILLGGEPTLYPDLKILIDKLADSERQVYLTTNGSRLTPLFVEDVLMKLSGINISIHNYNLNSNYEITGILLDKENLKTAIRSFCSDTKIRLNCNLIRGHIDSLDEVYKYISFAKDIGANGIRFAELKGDIQNWVDMQEIFGDEYGVNNEPFGLGCVKDAVIEDMPVNLRQMCGLQTNMRKRPVNPEQVTKLVMYYDGSIYKGWQKRGSDMTNKEREKILEAVRDGTMSIEDANKQLEKDREIIYSGVSASGCHY